MRSVKEIRGNLLVNRYRFEKKYYLKFSVVGEKYWSAHYNGVTAFYDHETADQEISLSYDSNKDGALMAIHYGEIWGEIRNA